jgi:hypothetical protein
LSVFVFALLALAAGANADDPGPPRITPAVNHSEPAHVRPVQRGFVGRKRDKGQAVTFSDVTGWRVLCYGKTEAEFVRSEEEPLFGEAVGRLTDRGPGPGYVRLEPPEPAALAQFNAMLMWVFGNNWSWVPDPTTPQVQIVVELEDKTGEKHVIYMEPVHWKFWTMLHKLIQPDVSRDERRRAWGGDGNGILDFPAALTAIEIHGGANTEFRSIYLDSIVFREEKPNPPRIDVRLDDLPFPTTPDPILPEFTENVVNRVTRRADSYVFRAFSQSQTIEYVYIPKTGTLSDLIVRIGDVEFRPCDGGGPLIGGKAISANLVSAKLDKGSVRTQWSGDGIDYALTLRIKGKSLICDWESNGTRITELTLGKATGLRDSQLFNVPYLTMGYGVTLPAVLYNSGAYCFTLFDWNNTNASQFYGGTERVSDTTALYNGGARYLNLTDGTRNQLRERQFITVSSKFEEVLPSIPNPPSPHGDVTGKYVYCHVQGRSIDRYQKWLKQWQSFKAAGIDYVRMSQHEDAWSDADTACQGPQEFTMTLEAAPEIGDRQLIEYCRGVRDLGWLIGLYTNYTDLSMLGKSWDERFVSKLPNGEWRRAWPPNFALKPLKAVEMEAYYAPRIAKKFGVNSVYCDVHTALAPWDYVDYEAGIPGAGMLATQFRSYAKLLMNERKAYGGPVYSEGWHHWFYAGICDASYGHTGLPDPANQPLLLDFDLRRIHPLCATVGMWGSWTWGDDYYHMLTTMIAYGHIGFLPPADVPLAARGYYLMQQLQSRYNMVPVETLLYRAADGRMLTVSEALPIGANKLGQVHVKYKNDLEIYANHNKAKHWDVTLGGKKYHLPPWGWVAAAPDFIEYSAEFDGRRVDFADSPEYTYMDAGDEPFDFGVMKTAGQVVIKKNAPGGPKVIWLRRPPSVPPIGGK